MKEEAPTRYRLQFHTEAKKEWNRLDGSIQQPLKKLLKKRLDEPFVSGAELTGNLKGCFRIKLLKQGYRLVYTVDLKNGSLIVLSVGRRDKSLAYISAASRLPPLDIAGEAVTGAMERLSDMTGGVFRRFRRNR